MPRVRRRDRLSHACLQCQWASAGQGRLLRLTGGGAVFTCLPWVFEEEANGQLIRAAKHGQIEQMHRLLRQGAHVNCSNDRGQSPLLKAAERGQTEAVVQLLKVGADIRFVDRHLSSALHYASFNGHPSTVVVLARHCPQLINQRNKFGYTPVHYAAADGHSHTIAALVALGANVHHVDNMQFTALHRAAAGGHVDAVYELVKSGASVDGVPSNDQASVEQPGKLLPATQRQAGRRAETSDHLIGSVGIRGNACLDLLVSPAEPTLDLRDSPKAGGLSDDRCPPLHAASARRPRAPTDTPMAPQASDSLGDAECVRGYTPLHEATWCNQLQSVKALVTLGADLLAKDKWGKTPLGSATRHTLNPKPETRSPKPKTRNPRC